jgi:PTS system fructose-specific IIC component
MKITDLLIKERVALGAELADQAAVIERLTDLMVASSAVSDREAFVKAIHAREAQSTTAIGDGLAVPHAKSAAVVKPALAALTLTRGVDYDAPDDEPADLFFMIASPPDADAHIDALAGLMTLIGEDNFLSDLRAAASPEDFLAVVDRYEGAKSAAAESAVSPGGFRILAVTACPTGIAHTYLAAEALEKAGRQLGVPIKIETNGSGGVQNRSVRPIQI